MRRGQFFCDTCGLKADVRLEAKKFREKMAKQNADMGHFVMYIIESKLPRERVFKPQERVFAWKKDALVKAADLREKFAHEGRQYRVTAYWDKRPW